MKIEPIMIEVEYKRAPVKGLRVEVGDSVEELTLEDFAKALAPATGRGESIWGDLLHAIDRTV